MVQLVAWMMAVAQAVWWSETRPKPIPIIVIPQIPPEDRVTPAWQMGYNNWLGEAARHEEID